MRPGLATAVVGLALFAAGAAFADGIEVKDAWIPLPPPGAPTAAGYATITNHQISSDRLAGAHSGAAASVDLHETTKVGGVVRMRPVQGGLAIGASASIKLAPMGDHLMLSGLKKPLVAGQHVKITLQFRRGGDVTADFVVKPAGAMHM
jgi:copper(I)-binding protein